jgi:hypothetical protein
METAWNIDWDYSFWIKVVSSNNYYSQKYWNQTLITKINQISAQIFKASFFAGANAISSNSKMFKIIETLEYFKKETMMLAGRYKVNVDDLILEDIIYVFRSDYPLEPRVIDSSTEDKPHMFITISEDSDKLPQYLEIKNITLKVIKNVNLRGKITVLNY